MTKRVVIIGAGFGGLKTAQALKKADVDILLIDKTNHHLFQPLLYQVATAALSPADIAMPIREVFRNQPNARVIMADVENIDLGQKRVFLKEGETADYDVLIIAVGGRHSYFGNPEWEKNAEGLKTLEDALYIRGKLLMAFEHAERNPNPEEQEQWMRFVIIGGGPTGVEMAGAIAEIARQTLFKNFRRIKPEDAQIFLVEGASQILPSYPERLAKKAQNDLEKMGVTVLLNAKVTNVMPEGVDLNGTFLNARTLIWAAGNEASPLVKKLSVPLDKQGRVIVNSDLSVPQHPDVFVIGDAACCLGKEGKPLPGIAPVAIQQASFVAKLIKRSLPPEKRPPFRYIDKGQMATIGRAKAVAMVGKIQISGLLAWLAWSFIHIWYLINFRSRFMVMLEWIFWYFSGHRNVRLIIPSIDEEK